jgi:hypothetical protein
MHRERALRIVLVVVGLLFSALAYPLLMFVKQEPAFGDDAEPLCNTRDGFHGMVELCPCRAYADAGIP